MDLDTLRKLRTQRYSGGSSSSCPSSNSGEQPSAAAPSEAVPTSPASASVMPSAAIPSAVLETSGHLLSNAGMLTVLTEVRDLLLALPATIAGALATATVTAPPAAPPAAPPTMAAALATTSSAAPPTMAAALATTSSAVPTASKPSAMPFVLPKPPLPYASTSAVVPGPSHAAPSEQVNSGHGAGTMSGGYDKDPVDCCGVCHMPIKEEPHAYINCGHFPFCTPCVEAVSKTVQCPYCKTEGRDVVLHFEE